MWAAGTGETGAAAPAGGGMDFGTGYMGSSIATGCGQLINGIAGAVSMYYQGKIMDSQFAMQKNQIETQGELVGIEQETNEGVLDIQEAHTAKMLEYQQALHGSEFAKVKAETELNITKEQVRQQKLTEKATKTDTKKIDRLFGRRGSYDIGQPVMAV